MFDEHRFAAIKHAKSFSMHVTTVTPSLRSGTDTKFFSLTNRQFCTEYTDSSLGIFASVDIDPLIIL